MVRFIDFLIKGIDISAYDSKLFIDKLVNKVNFVIVRIGHGTKTDLKFKEFWALLKNKIFRLAYFYLDYYSHLMKEFPYVYGKSNYEWGSIQAHTAWNNIKDDHDSKLVYVDIEQGDSSYAPDIDEVWDSIVIEVADGFVETYDELSGIVTGVYSSLSYLEKYPIRFRHRPLFLAWYNSTISKETAYLAARAQGWTGPIDFWQKASDGDTDGDGKGDGLEFGLGRPIMDLDIWMGTESEWKTFIAKSEDQGGELMNNILLNIPPIAQRDPRWATIQLGTSNKTIGSHGCVITDVTMMCRYFGINIDPIKLNTWLKANGGYQNLNWFVWSVLNKLDSRISFGYRYTYAALDKIDEKLEIGVPSIVNVDLIPATEALDEHWVLVVGKVDGSYIINDPWYGTQFKFEEKYGNPITGIKIVSTYNFTGTINTQVPSELGPALYRIALKEGITSLIIRTEPIQEKKFDTTKRAKYPEQYDIFDEQNGYGQINSGNWISLDSEYVTVIGPSLEDRVTALELRVSELGDLVEPTDIEKLAILWAWYKETHPS